MVPVIRIKTVEEGIEHCNTNNLALQGCLFTTDINKAIKYSDAMMTGTVQINAAPARGPDREWPPGHILWPLWSNHLNGFTQALQPCLLRDLGGSVMLLAAFCCWYTGAA